MKNYALVLVAALTVNFVSSTATAGQLDKMSYSQIVKMDLSKVEQIYIDDLCAAEDCRLPDWVRNPHKLTKAERLALYQYSNGYYLEINPALASGKINGSQTGFVRILDSALKKIPAEEALVYRGTSQRSINIQKGDEGKILTLPTYTSTTVEEDDAKAFVRDRLMIIKVLRGKNIKAYANAPNEDEILLPRGVQLRVDKIEMKKVEIFTEDQGPVDRLVQVVELTQI